VGDPGSQGTGRGGYGKRTAVVYKKERIRRGKGKKDRPDLGHTTVLLETERNDVSSQKGSEMSVEMCLVGKGTGGRKGTTRDD